MIVTRFSESLGLTWPIVQAGLGTIAGAEIAAAVSEAGGLGTIALVQFPPDLARAEVRRARTRTRRPLAVNFLLPMLDPAALDAVLEEDIQVVTFFWGDVGPWVARVHAAGACVVVQVGSVDEAAAAADAGADAVIAQGVEAGGHVRGTTSMIVLVPLVVDRVAPLPVLAAGGIGDARGIAAALAVGAEGAVLGTRFVLTPEVGAHPRYQQAIAAARPDDTCLTTEFDVEWPDAPHRVLRLSLAAWEAAGRPPRGERPGEGESIGTLAFGPMRIPLQRYTAVAPARGFTGDVEALPFYAGQSCGLAHDVEPAGALVRRLGTEAEAIVGERLPRLVRAA
jgi:NAD(P)H-dependent flavin oxidoreductase YrpB (nitropropane dioxygenase family)